MNWVRGQNGIVHIMRRWQEDGSVAAWCGASLAPVTRDFIKAPRQRDAQCIRCQDNAWRER